MIKKYEVLSGYKSSELKWNKFWLSSIVFNIFQYGGLIEFVV